MKIVVYRVVKLVKLPYSVGIVPESWNEAM